MFISDTSRRGRRWPAKPYHHLLAVPAEYNNLLEPTVKVSDGRWNDAPVGVFSVASYGNTSGPANARDKR